LTTKLTLMKRQVLLAISFLCITSLAGAQVLFNENFSYTPGQLSNLSGGANVSGGNWTTVSGSLPFPVSVYAALPNTPNYDGYASSGTGNIAGIGNASIAATEDVRRAFTDQLSGTVYAAYLFNIGNRTGLLSSGNGDYGTHLTNIAGTGGGFYTRLYVRSSGNGVNFGFLATSPNTTPVYSSTVYDTLTTHLIVVSYEFVAGAANDIGRLWINPPLTGVMPAPTLMQVASGTEPDGLDAFGLRQGTNSPIAGIDGIRVATSWADVIGNPVSNVSFTQASTTSATIEWDPQANFNAANSTTVVFVKQGSPITIGTPTQGPGFYTANSDFSGSSTAFENDASAKTVYKGDDSSVTITGLTSGNMYHVLVYTIQDADSAYSSAGRDSGSIVLTPVLSFTAGTSLTDESAVNDTIRISITNPDTAATSVDVVLTSSGNATQGSDFTYSSTQTITFPASSSANINIAIPIADDAAIEGTETFVLKLQNATNGATFGVNDSIIVSIIDNDFNPSISFNAATQSVKEGEDSVSITLDITNANSTATSVDVVVASGTATNGTDYTYSTQTITFPASSSASRTFKIGINDDSNVESSEYFVLMLQNPTNNATLGNTKDSVIILDNDYNYYSIDQVNNIDANGVPDSSGVKLAVRGIVYGINTGTSPAVTFFIRDNTGGIGAFSSKSFGYTVTEGDSVAVAGVVGTFRGLTQLSPLDTIILLGTGKPVKSPTVVTTLSESTEADYVQLNSVRLVNPSAWPATGANATLSIVHGTDTLTMFIDKETDIDGTTAPTGYFNVAGMGSQFAPTATAPFVGGYQIVPMRLSDIDAVDPSLTFSTTAQSVGEGNDTAFITVKMTVPSTAAVTVDVVISGGTATSPSDYTFTPATQTLTFAANTTDSMVIKIPIVNDVDFESNETIIVKLQNATAGTMIADSLHTVTIIDNETSGTGSISAAANISVYPNPASGLVTLETNGYISSYIVYDISGREVIRSSGSNNVKAVGIDVNGLNQGIYYIRASVEGKLVTAKFVKQ
jgi:hypothetical protein